jgi:glutamine synthetase
MSAPWMELAWPDRDGRLRGATVPGDAVADAVRAIRIDPADLGWPGVPGPLRPEPDVEAHALPWAPDRELRLCFLRGPDGNESPACTRSALGRALGDAERGGYEVIAAAEVEFFLARPDDRRPVYSAIENYGIVAGAPYEPVMARIRSLRHAGVPVVASNPEYGGGQFEVNLMHGPALAAADAVSLLRTWGGAIAAREGLAATFSAKPWPDGSGSGMHIHQSLWRNGENAFWERDGVLSGAGRSYLAGLLDAMGELAPLGSPTPLAYTRRSDGSFCPTTVSWGGDNRTVAVRVLVDDAASTRIEQRDAAADASPHLALAGQVAAGLAGIADGREPPATVEGDAYTASGLPRLPRSLEEALPLFAASALARRVLGEEAHASFCGSLEALVEAELAGTRTGPDPDGGW